MPDIANQPWYKQLASACNSLAEELGLDDFGSTKMREFVFATAKDQFRAGNRSGIRWARSTPATQAVR